MYCDPVKFTLSLQMLFKKVQNVIKFFGKKNLFFDRPTLKIFKKLHETRNFFI